MAFDMYVDKVHEMIGTNEEFIFSLAEQEGSLYPELMSIWEAFYKDSRLSVSQADSIAHELIALLAHNGGSNNKHLTSVVIRLLTFFSFAYTTKKEIKCVGD
jgi:hypothetical protein